MPWFCNICKADTIICQVCGGVGCSKGCHETVRNFKWFEGIGNVCEVCHKRVFPSEFPKEMVKRQS